MAIIRSIKEKLEIIKEQLTISSRRRIFYILFFILILSIIAFLFINSQKKDISVFEIESKDYEEIIVAAGQMKMSAETSIIAEVSGYISYIGAGEGETLASNEVIIKIDNTDKEKNLEQKKANYEDYKAQYDKLIEYDYPAALAERDSLMLIQQKAKKDYNAASALFKEGAMSESECLDYKSKFETADSNLQISNLKVNSLSASGSQRETVKSKLDGAKSAYESEINSEEKYSIKVPWDSYVLKLYSGIRDYVEKGQVLADIGQAGSYYVICSIDEKYYTFIEKNIAAYITVGDISSESYEGHIESKTPKIDKNTGTFDVKILLNEELPFEASDLTVNVNIVLQKQKDAIAISDKYLIDGESAVYVMEKGQAVKRKIEYKNSLSNTIVVEKGLKEGDEIIIPEAI